MIISSTSHLNTNSATQYASAPNTGRVYQSETSVVEELKELSITLRQFDYEKAHPLNQIQSLAQFEKALKENRISTTIRAINVNNRIQRFNDVEYYAIEYELIDSDGLSTGMIGTFEIQGYDIQDLYGRLRFQYGLNIINKKPETLDAWHETAYQVVKTILPTAIILTLGMTPFTISSMRRKRYLKETVRKALMLKPEDIVDPKRAIPLGLIPAQLPGIKEMHEMSANINDLITRIKEGNIRDDEWEFLGPEISCVILGEAGAGKTVLNESQIYAKLKELQGQYAAINMGEVMRAFDQLDSNSLITKLLGKKTSYDHEAIVDLVTEVALEEGLTMLGLHWDDEHDIPAETIRIINKGIYDKVNEIRKGGDHQIYKKSWWHRLLGFLGLGPIYKLKQGRENTLKTISIELVDNRALFEDEAVGTAYLRRARLVDCRQITPNQSRDSAYHIFCDEFGVPHNLQGARPYNTSQDDTSSSGKVEKKDELVLELSKASILLGSLQLKTKSTSLSGARYRALVKDVMNLLSKLDAAPSAEINHTSDQDLVNLVQGMSAEERVVVISEAIIEGFSQQSLLDLHGTNNTLARQQLKDTIWDRIAGNLSSYLYISRDELSTTALAIASKDEYSDVLRQVVDYGSYR